MSAPPFSEDLYEHLRAIANRVHRDRGGGSVTLQPTALVHEAWLKLGSTQRFESRLHFLRAAALAMRQVFVDHERARRAARRGGGAQLTTLSGVAGDDHAFELLEVDEALRRLESLDPEGAQVVVLRAFGGLSIPEVAEVMDVSERTISSRWRHARAWLLLNLQGGSAEA